jgi:hypothetical protein
MRRTDSRRFTRLQEIKEKLERLRRKWEALDGYRQAARMVEVEFSTLRADTHHVLKGYTAWEGVGRELLERGSRNIDAGAVAET